MVNVAQRLVMKVPIALGSPTDPARPISGASERVIIDVPGPAVNSPEEFTMTPV